jgi:hypothetical protein
MNGRDIFLSKWGGDGKLQWTRTLGTPRDDLLYGLALTADGRLLLAGSTEGSWAAPTHSSASPSGSDALVLMFPAQLDANTPPTWSRQIAANGGSYENFDAVTVRADGKVVAAGRTSGVVPGTGASPPSSFEGLVMAFEPADGTTLWARQWATRPYVFLDGAAADGNTVYVTGTYGEDEVSRAPFLSQLDAQGVVRWETSFPVGGASGASGRGGRVVARGGRIYATYTLGADGHLAALDANHAVLVDHGGQYGGLFGLALGPSDSLLWSTAAGLLQVSADAAGFQTRATYSGASWRAAYGASPSELIVNIPHSSPSWAFLRPSP